MTNNKISNIEILLTKNCIYLQLEQHIIDFSIILLNIIGAKDNYTRIHSIKVANLALYFGNYLNLTKEKIQLLYLAALLHDIGKIGVKDNILLKNTKLTNNEYNQIKLHPTLGANLLNVSKIYKDICPIIESHHERYDGNGYPNRLKGENIPYLARLLSICDSFDAIISQRPYKKPKTIDYALEQIKKEKETQFDKYLAESFITMVKENFHYIQKILSE